ncbi:VOC family protein [Dyadobacter sp. CY312]|uniref:VOC family protein n=1 Tax=Dyadobacter sp. CY312 TaxID=2907303 RepID=UPI001F226635|nr:VOC family protein [Dyadobacter sp. CY312]MCE7039875.1 VOC family protein [Dyadobacter sp. CY312]
MAAQNPVGWFEIYVTDMDRARKFYETVLKVTLTELPAPEGMGEGQMFAFPGDMTAPGTSGALVKHEMGEPSATGTLLYFSCEDCATEIGRVEAAGGKVIAEKFSIGDFGFCGITSDTEGNTIGFHSMN